VVPNRLRIRASRAAASIALALTGGALLAACGAAPPPPPPRPAARVEAPPEPPARKLKPYRCTGKALSAGGRDYCAYTSSWLSWQDAKRACEDTGARLASFPTEEVALALFGAVGPPAGPGRGYWIGLTEPAHRAGEWRWLSGAPLTEAHWDGGEPNNSGGDEACAEWKIASGAWNDLHCDTERGYVCERQGTDEMTCIGETVKTQSGEYCVVNADLSWEEARDQCLSAGAALAVLEGPNENQRLAAAIGPKLGVASVWVGWNDLKTEGTWEWVSHERPTYFPWRPGEPNNYKADEDCGEWYLDNGEMNDLPCSFRRAYICERPR
jgi:hypothetical protein